MSIMTTFTRRSLAKNKVRSAVTIAGIALAAVLLTAVLTSVGSLGNFMYRNELVTSGTWTAKVWTDSEPAARMAQDPEIESVATLTDMGFVDLPYEDAMRQGEYLSVVGAQGDVSSICAISASEGRLPEKPGEIMLPSYYSGENDLFGEACKVGDTVTLDVGVRISAGGEQLSSARTVDDMDGDGVPDETLESVRENTYTIVGFYDSSAWMLTTSVGRAALTVDDAGSEGAVLAYAVLADPQSMDHISSVLDSYATRDRGPDVHYGLLRHLGLFDDRAIWDTFGMMAAVLAAIIILACVSLIYNAFGISVAERKRQFGLLASIGASKRQIRASVFYEAGLMSLAGIPLGILVGIAGTGAVLGWLAPMIEQVLAFRVPFMMHVDLPVLGAVALLTLLTVIMSAWIPALRASRVTAMEAIRGSRDAHGGREVSAGRHGVTGEADASRLLKPRGISFARLFGAPAEIARLNRKRGRGKGTAASVSLAVAVVLLMAAGSFSTYLRITSDVMGSAADYDIGLSSGALGDLGRAEGLYEELTSMDGVTGRGWYSMRGGHLPDP